MALFEQSGLSSTNKYVHPDTMLKEALNIHIPNRTKILYIANILRIRVSMDYIFKYVFIECY